MTQALLIARAHKSDGSPRRSRWSSFFVAVLLASMLSLSIYSPVQAKVPTGGFAVFSQCPRFTPAVKLCLFAQITNGEIVAGGLPIPIGKPITLRGGLTYNEENDAETFVGALNGESLTKTPLAVPGGLLGIVDPGSLPAPLKRSFQEVVNRGLSTVTATSELAGLPLVSTDNIVNEDGRGLSLPVRIKLDNPFLGNACYIGTNFSPVTLNMTTGKMIPPPPNKPIKGTAGDIEFIEEARIDAAFGISLVDNSFAVPGATGCGGVLSPVLDPVIDRKIGLPSAAGRNTAIENGTVEDTLVKSVIASEK